MALHTSEMMQAARAIYARMGFVWLREAPPVHGVPYGLYIKYLRGDGQDF